MNEEFRGWHLYMEMSESERPRLIDRNLLRSIRAALDSWERRPMGSKKPDELLTDYLSAIKQRGSARWPEKELLDEVKSILARIENASIVKFTARSYAIAEREAFWLCLGLVLGGKASIEMFSSGIKNIDKAVSTK